MTRLTVEALQLIDAIDRSGSLSGAAELLHKVPSTISYAVTKVEQQLKAALFERGGGRLTLTAAGRELLREGRFLLAACADLEHRVQRIATGCEAELRIACDSLYPIEMLLPHIIAFQAENFGTHLRFAQEVMSGTWEALRDGRADLILATGEGPAGGGYATAALGMVRFVFCVAPQHPLAQQTRPLEKADLLPHTAIVVADSARALPSRSVGMLSGQPRITVSDLATKLELQKAGVGCGFLPRYLAAPALASGALVQLPLAHERDAESCWLAWRPPVLGKALQWWINHLTGMTYPDNPSGISGSD